MALAGGAKTRTLFDSKGTARRRIRGARTLHAQAYTTVKNNLVRSYLHALLTD